ncbi:hypothetical protein [Sphingomonas sp. dw_22]|nr:hypothetical protein [Sphingomonas sp. dw_22]
MQTFLNAAQMLLGLAVLALIFLLARRLRRLRATAPERDPTSGFRDPCR